MFPKKDIPVNVLGNGKLKAFVLESGNLKEVRDDIIRVNTFVGNNLEPTVFNLFMAVDNKYSRLIGIGSPSSFSIEEDCNGPYACYKGSFCGVQYNIIFSVFENALFFKVHLDKCPGKYVKLYYGMDVSLSNIYAISNNESYVSQYIDHKAFNENDSYILCSRQNQDRPIYLESGAFGKTLSYSVDGFDFYGLDYKFTNKPVTLEKGILTNRIYQYEFGYHALQSEELDLNSETDYVFYSYYDDNHGEAITKPLYQERVRTLYNEVKNRLITGEGNKLELVIDYENVACSKDFTEQEIDYLFDKRFEEERKDNKLLSFFTSDKSHVVIKDKELLLERPSGNIIISQNVFPNGDYDFENVLSSTGYIYGLFNSQIVIGNTSFNKLLSNQRNPLNIAKMSGQRLFIKIKGKYHLLTMPGIFVMGINYLKWFYKINDDVIEITSFTALRNTKLELSFKSHNGKQYDLLLVNHLVMGEREHESLVHVKKKAQDVMFLFDKNSMTYGKYPKLSFRMNISDKFKILDDSCFYRDKKSREENLLVLKLKSDNFNVLISSNKEDHNHLDFVSAKNEYLKGLNDFSLGFNIENENDKKELTSLNYLVYWYIHDALIHYLSPHGLEQYNGAAWGTRDVCQGPAELFLAFGHHEKVRKIILDVYTHQYMENGSFPQWFMFDKFYNIQDTSSHGDIIVWPVRLLALYLETTSDYSILNEKVPYTTLNGIKYTKKYKVLDHLKKEIEAIKNSFIPGTSLASYGGGDWDDTLQPAHTEYKKEMVSGWTVSLMFEAFTRLGYALDGVNALGKKLLSLSKTIKKDYHKYLIKDGVPAGFIRFVNQDLNDIRYILHPSDDDSNISYRLLPMTRGVISNIFSEEEKKDAMNIVYRFLRFPDGVRLMNTTVPYNGGIKSHFNRAETAANFGREIGLQYCHANVRYAEACAKMGFGSEMLYNLAKINPVIVNDVVENAIPRQRNSYFSSSDGAFSNRYEAMASFDKLRTREIGVKGGWRVYSSGPGIYLRTVIQDLLGIKINKDNIIINPVVDSTVGTTKLTLNIDGKKVLIKYYLNKDYRKLLFNNREINGTESGYLIDKKELKDDNLIEIFLDNPLINKEINGCLDFFLDYEGELGLTIDKIYLKEKKKNERIKNRSSTASIGFALASYVIGVKRKLLDEKDAKKIVRKTFDSLLKIEDFHGLLPHFVETDTGLNRNSEFSTIDTAILLMGVLVCGFYFGGDILKDALFMVNRVDWDHFITTDKDGKKVIKMAYSTKYWQDNDGYCPACWDHYAEQLMIYYLYAIQDKTSKETSEALYLGFKRHLDKYKDYEYIHCYANALFIHQFTHLFLDFRRIETSDQIDWYENSVLATLANRDYCIEQRWSKTYNDNSWGLSAFQGKERYKVYGAPPFGFPGVPYKQDLDGSVAPYAPLSSFAFTPTYSLEALEFFNTIKNLNGKYGIHDTYNYDTNYVSDCLIGIDKGPTIIMMDNYQNHTVWDLMMNNEISLRAFDKLGFKIINK